MSVNQKATVYLPNTTPSVDLPGLLAVTLELTINARDKGINTLELQQAGLIDPANCISRLKKYGAIIFTERKPAINISGVEHKSIAHYIYCGWTAKKPQTKEDY